MSGRDPDRRVDQLVREDRGDLRRHRVGGVGEVRPDEYLEWPSPLRRLSQHSPIALPLAPLLVKPIATRQGRDAGMAARSERKRR